uniref:Glycosyltransferase family 92 protein n=1 Tax=Strongyloides venezuelensis TaxID=75913 RepID=A0A0K0F3Q1_STRVS
MKFYLVPRNYYSSNHATIKGTFMGHCSYKYVTKKKIENLFIKINSSYYKGDTDNINFFLCPKKSNHFCQLWPHRIHFNVPWKIAENLKEVQLVNTKTGTNRIFPLDTVAANSKPYEGIVVCVPVLYYYNNWLQIFLFLEKWREEDNAKIVIYYKSLSLDVYNLLKYYEEIKLVTLLPAPNFPTGGKARKKSATSFYISHLFFDDCMYGRNGKYFAVMDVDEYFHIFDKNIKLLDLIKKHSTIYPSKTFFNFESMYMSYDNHNLDESFIFGKTVTLTKDTQNIKGKSVTLTDKNEYIGYHFPLDKKNIVGYNYSNDFNYSDGYRFPADKAILLHARPNYVLEKINSPKKINILTESQRLTLVNHYKSLNESLKIKTPFIYKRNVVFNLKNCMKNNEKRAKNARICSSNYDICHKRLKNLEKWVYAEGDKKKYYSLIRF